MKHGCTDLDAGRMRRLQHLLAIAFPLIVGNMLGSYVGSKLAILRGCVFIRGVLLGIVLVLMARFPVAAVSA